MSASPSFQAAAWQRLKKNKGAMFGLVVIAAAILTAIFAYLLAPDHSPDANRQIPEIKSEGPGFTKTFVLVKFERNIAGENFFHRLLYGARDKYAYIPVDSYTATSDSIIAQKYIDEGVTERVSWPVSALAAKPVVTKKFIAGVDKQGRDIFSRLILGTRISLGVGFTAVIISLTIGLVLGSLAGYYRGRTDSLIMWFINVMWSVPTLLLAFAISLALGKGYWQVFVAIGLTMWVNVARTVRGQILVEREKEYVEAAKALGYSGLRTIIKHIWPNIMGPVMVIAASNFASAIIVEAGLSFIGIGVQPPQPSWGFMMKDNYNFLITHQPLLALAPGFAIMLLVLAFNLVGNGLRDALNVRGRI